MTRLPAILERARASGVVREDSLANIERAWLDPACEPWCRDSIEELVTAEEWQELNDRFFRGLGFGTGGMRGRTIGKLVTTAEKGAGGPLGRPEHAAVGTAMFNDANVRRAAEALGRYLEKAFPGEALQAVVSHDTRHFSREFALAVAEVLGARGVKTWMFAEERSTPQLSFSVRLLKAHAGVVITASHNPPHDNGFKAYFQDGGQLVEPHTTGVIDEYRKLEAGLAKASHPPAMLGPDADEAYRKAVLGIVLEPDVVAKMGGELRVVFTSIHGTGGKMIPELLGRMGVRCSEVEAQAEPDGRFPTVKSPNPENAEALAMAVAQAERDGADLVIGTDPDADRMGIAVRGTDGSMRLLSGNKIGSILAWYRCARLFAQGVLNASNRSRAAIIKTIVTTDLQRKIAEHFGVKCVDTLTGFKYIGEKMLEYERATGAEDYDALSQEERRRLQLEKGTFFVFGGEESYGYSGGDYVRDKDANAAAVMIAEAAAWAKTNGQTLQEYLDAIYRELGFFEEKLGTITFEGAEGAEDIRRLVASYEQDPPKSYAGVAVRGCDHYGKSDFRDADGKLLPKEPVLMFHLADGSRMAVRASGTEPKIKFYFFTNAPAREDLESVKAERLAFLEKWWQEVKQDVKARVSG